MITSFSNSKFEFSINTLYSMILADPYMSILLIDLGIKPKKLEMLLSHIQSLHEIQEKLRSNGIIAYRKILWKNLPTWMNLRSEEGKSIRGGNAWKLFVISDAFFEWKSCVAWIDGGSIIVDGLSREMTSVRMYGVYSPRSSGSLGEWTVVNMQSFLRKNHFVEVIDKEGPNCMAGVFFIDYSHLYTHYIAQAMKECAFTKKCLAPRGANLANHRFDQSLLSILVNSYHIPRVANSQFQFHPALKNMNVDATPLLHNLMLMIQVKYRIYFSNEEIETNRLKLSNVTIINTSRQLDF